MISCMGGWCALRTGCRHYYAEGSEPVERICIAGHDGESDTVSIVIHRPAGTWEANGQRQQQAAGK